MSDVFAGHRYPEQPHEACSGERAGDQVGQGPPEDQFTSSVTLGELLYGAHRSSRTAALLERIEETLLPELPILPFDAGAARRYGELRTELERRGTPIGDADTRLASIALSRGLTVVTGNERHFRQVPGLEIENWLKD